MRSPVRAFASPLVAGFLLVTACGTPEQDAQPDSVAAVAEQLADQTAAGDHCGAQETAAYLRTLVAEEPQLPEASRAQVAEFLTSLDAQLQCEPAPDPTTEEPAQTEEPPADQGDDDNPGKGKGRKGGDDDDDDEDD